MNKVILIFKKEILDAIRDTRTFFVCVITPFLLYPILIFKKEILDAIRDTRTFFVWVITPFLLYPILFIVMGYFMQ
ncbi:unnamed protein product, partial [marine sediment metagenome]